MIMQDRLSAILFAWRARMKKVLSAILAGSSLLCVSVNALGAPPVDTQKAAAPAPKLKVGDEAPDFTLKYSDGSGLKEVKLSDYRGKKNVALAFFVFAFTGG
jgi:cytochrome oxidase Cu insertion factor (SCO1/SenC/PrrC family)